MTISYVQGSNPYWYFTDFTGKPAGSGTVYFYDSLNPDNLKTVYQDAAGLLPYPNPIDINLNGTVPAIYFKVDSGNLNQTYDIWAYDASGDVIENVMGFLPSGTGGGGSPTTIFNLINLIDNNVMYRNNGPVAQSLGAGSTILAPGAHQGLAQTISNFGPDICFIKNNTSATDTVAFTPFTFGLLPMSPSDSTPYDYCNFNCTSAGSAESTKLFQFPITNKVQNLSDQLVSGTIWGKCASGNTALILSACQFFGDGSAASNPTATGNTVVTQLAAITLTATWTQYNFSSVSIPSVATGSTGQCGNDGLFVQINVPLNAATSIQFTKPCLYLGARYTAQNYINYDNISGQVEAPRTGDVRITINNFGFGWVLMNDGGIGDAASGATTRKNLDTFPLYNWLWNNVGVVYAPMVDTNPYGASSIADFSANRAISLTKQAGRLIAGIGVPSSGSNTGNNWALGQNTGNELDTLVLSNLPDHTHNAPGGTQFALKGAGGGLFAAGLNETSGGITGGITGFPGQTAINIQNPVAYQNIWMKL